MRYLILIPCYIYLIFSVYVNLKHGISAIHESNAILSTFAICVIVMLDIIIRKLTKKEISEDWKPKEYDE